MQRLLHGLESQKLDVRHFCLKLDSIPGIHVAQVDRFYDPLALLLLDRIGRRARLSGAARAMRRELLAKKLQSVLKQWKPDVVNLHNIHASSSGPWLLTVLGGEFPVVWTLHDMWSFTGRCAYAYDCDSFSKGCDENCPTPGEYPSLPAAKIRSAWLSKKEFFRRTATTIAVCPSRWLRNEAERGFWENRTEHIPYGIDLKAFKSMGRKTAREYLGIREDEFVLLAVAVNLSERRKGGQILSDASRMISFSGTVLLMGSGNFDQKLGKLNARFTGYITDDAAKVLFYSAADVLVHPAPVDNLPNVVIEALACGLPVVALPIGGLSDMVVADQTGWLAPSPDAEGLAYALEQAYATRDELSEKRVQCRKFAQEHFALEHQAKAYVQLFENVIRYPVMSDWARRSITAQ